MIVAGLGISTQLIADDGLVYAIANGIGTKVLAFDARDGEQAWRQDMPTGDQRCADAALDGDDLFLGYGCKGAFGMAKDTGYAQWWHDGNCQIEGRYVRTSSLHGARLYSGEQPVYVPAPGTINDTSTGKPVGTFAGDGGLPAFAGDMRLQVRQGTLEAYDERSGSIAWTFAGDGELTGAPVIAAGHAFAGSRSGAVYAVRIADGSLAWEGTAGAPVTIAGLAVAQGTLAVPAGTRLVAFREAGLPQTGGPHPIALEPVDVGRPPPTRRSRSRATPLTPGAAGALTPPLRERWRRPVEGRYSYALSAGGRIFAVREPWSANAVRPWSRSIRPTARRSGPTRSRPSSIGGPRTRPMTTARCSCSTGTPACTHSTPRPARGAGTSAARVCLGERPAGRRRRGPVPQHRRARRAAPPERRRPGLEQDGQRLQRRQPVGRRQPRLRRARLPGERRA